MKIWFGEAYADTNQQFTQSTIFWVERPFDCRVQDRGVLSCRPGTEIIVERVLVPVRGVQPLLYEIPYGSPVTFSTAREYRGLLSAREVIRGPRLGILLYHMKKVSNQRDTQPCTTQVSGFTVVVVRTIVPDGPFHATEICALVVPAAESGDAPTTM